jgi:cytochrome c oxidase cbb3-type subunit 1
MDESSSSKPISDWKDIDTSYRFPTLFLVAKATGWLLISTLFSLLASIKMHSPEFLSNCSWVTYGVLVPAARNAFIYGFALQAGFAAMLWMTMRLGQVKLRGPGFIFIGMILWNLALVLGILGLMGGGLSGYAFLDMPGFVYPMLFTAYALIGGMAILTFFKRQVRELYPSQWFIYASFYWFPWMLTIASYALFSSEPARGIAQALINQWYVSGMTTIVLGFVGLALVQYFIPKLSGRDLYSSHLSFFAFWMMLLFGGLTGLLEAQSLPAWAGVISSVCSHFVSLAWVIVAYNLWKSLQGSGRGSDPFALLLVRAAALSGLVGALLTAWGSRPAAAELVQFSLFLPGLTWLQLFGFVGTLLLVSIYYFLPRVTELPWKSGGLLSWKGVMTCYFSGVSLISLVYLVGGWKQGKTLADASKSFAEVQAAAMTFIRISTVGELLVFVAALMVCLKVTGMLIAQLRAYIQCCCSCKSEATQ